VSLSSIISSAAAQFQGGANTGRNQIAATINPTNIGSNLATQASLTATGLIGKGTSAVNGAINAGLHDITNAAGQLFQGNVSGALSTLANAPGDVLNSLSKSFGFSSGTTLTGPGSAATLGNNLAGALARSDPLLSFQWYASMPAIAPVGGSTVQLPWYFVEEATPTFRSFEPISIFREGRQKHYAGKYSVDSLRLGIYADTAGIALTYLQAWNGAILSPTTPATEAAQGGAYGKPNNYKQTIVIYLINPNNAQVATLTYVECWPQTIDSYTLDSGSSTRIINNVTFSVGDVFISIASIPSAVSNAAISPQNPGGSIMPLSPTPFSLNSFQATNTVGSTLNLNGLL
jgi:hypothetical protein